MVKHTIWFYVFGTIHSVDCKSISEARTIWDALKLSPDIEMKSARP